MESNDKEVSNQCSTRPIRERHHSLMQSPVSYPSHHLDWRPKGLSTVLTVQVSFLTRRYYSWKRSRRTGRSNFFEMGVKDFGTVLDVHDCRMARSVDATQISPTLMFSPGEDSGVASVTTTRRMMKNSALRFM